MKDQRLARKGSIKHLINIATTLLRSLCRCLGLRFGVRLGIKEAAVRRDKVTVAEPALCSPARLACQRHLH